MRERELIASIEKLSQKKSLLLIQGIGDDCAVFSSVPGSDWIISTDMLVEGVHFDLRWHPPELLGRKCLAVNLSDLAAMAGTPSFVLLSVALPDKCSQAWLDLFLKGFSAALSEYGCILIGGDTVSGQKLTFSVTVLGTVAQNKAILRSQAQAGDAVYVSGYLGSAAAGLHLCQQENLSSENLSRSKWSELLRCHLNPIPEIQFAQHLLTTGMVSAMQDISDGIATDLSHICQRSTVGACLHTSLLPAHPQLVVYCQEKNLNMTDFQLKGGEDYQLVFTVKKQLAQDFEQKIFQLSGRRPWKIGEITAGKGIRLRDDAGKETDVTFQGYEHASTTVPQEE